MDFDLSEHHQILKDSVRRFAVQEIGPKVAVMDRDETFDEVLWQKGRELGFVGMGISPEYDGSFSDYVSLGIIAEEVSKIDPGVAVVFGATISRETVHRGRRRNTSPSLHPAR